MMQLKPVFSKITTVLLKIEGSKKLTRCGFGSYAQPTQVVYGSEVPYHSCCLPYRVGFRVGQSRTFSKMMNFGQTSVLKVVENQMLSEKWYHKLHLKINPVQS